MLMFSSLFDPGDTQNQCDIADRSITMLLFFCMKVGASFREHFFQARFCFVSSKVEVLTCMQEAGTGFASKPQTDDAEPGDIALDSWVRYDDPEVRTFKLNAERQNGRAAMLGITGCLIHELLGVDALYPTGGFDGASPDPIIDGATSFANFPSFI